MRRYALRTLLLVCAVAAVVPAMAFAEDFDDVPAGAYYHEAVGEISNEGITAGTGGGHYDPDSPVSRGQLAVFLHRLIAARPATFVAFMNGANEVPGPGDADGTGSAFVHIGRDTVCYEITTTGVDPFIAGHIHTGAAGVAGGIVVDLMPFAPLPEDGNASGCVPGDPTVLAQIKAHPGDYYVNVHTEPFPAGAVRGQLETL